MTVIIYVCEVKMSIVIRKNNNREVFERLYQLFCYETGEGVMGADALYTVPDKIAYTVEKGGIPCGFAIFSEERCLDILFLLKEHRKMTGEILTTLFDENKGKWSVPCEFENVVREYTMGDYRRETGLVFDNSACTKAEVVDYSDVSSVVNAYEATALKHGECITQRCFADAAKYSALLFSMREKIMENGIVSDVVTALVDKGDNVTVWTAGLAFSAGVVSDEVIRALKKVADDGAFSASARLLLEEYGI